MEAPIKPLVLMNDELKKELIDSFNQVVEKYHPPFFLLEQIIRDLHEEIKFVAEQERIQAKEQYTKAMTEYQMANSASNPNE